MQPALPLSDRPGDFIAGQFVAPEPADGELRVCCPGDIHEHVSTHAYSLAHVDAAVSAARDAQRSWARTSEDDRRALLHRYQERLRAHRDDIALAIALEVGKPLWEARTEADAMISKVDLCLGDGASFTRDVRVDGLPGEIRYRPLGVLAVIGPFNFPGHLPNGQIVPALLLGNSVVHKPSEKTPTTATFIARCLHEAGLPAGVFNVIQGAAESGRRLCVHDGVDGVLFTGSAAVGRRIVQDNAAHIERLIALELGGKNAAIALDDCDLERTARAVAFAAFASAGQRCTSTSRLYATPGIADALVQRIAQIGQAMRIGHPLAPDVFMGPLISQAAREALLAAQARARDAGFTPVLAGGPEKVAGHEGFYVRPAIHRAPGQDAHDVPGYSDDELFAPDLAVYTAPDLEAAIALANRSRFGLAASVFTRSRKAFEHAAESLRVGVVHHNRSSAGASGRLPFGGVKQSGNHRPAGILAGTACAHPQSLLHAQEGDGPLPTWPGVAI